MTATCASPNVLHLGDILWQSNYGFGRLYYPGTAFLVRVAGFTPDGVQTEAVERSDDPCVDNEWTVPHAWLRRSHPEHDG